MKNHCLLFSGDGCCSISMDSIHGRFVGFHDRLRLGPRIPKRTNQHIRPCIIEGIFAIRGFNDDTTTFVILVIIARTCLLFHSLHKIIGVRRVRLLKS